MYPKESIVAIATGAASGGLGVIRVSGEKAKSILEKVFLPKHQANFNFRPRYMHYGSFVLPNTFLNSTGGQLADSPAEVSKSQTPNYASLKIPCFRIFCKRRLQKILNEGVRGKSFPPKKEKKLLCRQTSGGASGLSKPFVTEENFVLDEILAVYFPNPHSYTGEDVVEIHAHGGSALLQSMLEYIVSLGVRHAEAGEFTKRAFLNGRIDLSQAEAVAEIISAPAIEGVRLASAKLHGVLGRRIEDLRNQIEYIRRRLCLAIDFPEEEGECLPAQEFHALVNILYADIEQLISAYDRAKPWNEGSLVVLAGQVNAGKSSLMNAFLGRQRAIVTAEAGTTRDYLEEASFLAGLPVRLTDTAGLREIALVVQHASQDEYGLSPQILERLSRFVSADCEQGKSIGTIDEQGKNINSIDGQGKKNNSIDEQGKKNNSIDEQGKKQSIGAIEAEGIRRSLELMDNADLVFLVFDGRSLHEQSSFDTANTNAIAQIIASAMQAELSLLPDNVKRICIWNKADIAPLSSEIRLAVESIIDVPIFCISARSQNISRVVSSVAINLPAPADSSAPLAPAHSVVPAVSAVAAQPAVAAHSVVPAVSAVAAQPAVAPHSVVPVVSGISDIHSIDELAKAARAMLLQGDFASDEIAPNRRQAGLLKSAKSELDYLKTEIDILPPDLSSIRLESCAQYLSAITGLCSVDDTFNAIFAEFCIGK